MIEKQILSRTCWFYESEYTNAIFRSYIEYCENKLGKELCVEVYRFPFSRLTT